MDSLTLSFYYERYISVFDTSENINIEPVILDALLKKLEVDQKIIDVLKLAVRWNQYEEANTILQRAKVIK